MPNRQKIQLARWTSGIAFLFTLSTVGGLERFSLTLGTGIAYIALGFTVFAIAGLKGGIFR